MGSYQYLSYGIVVRIKWTSTWKFRIGLGTNVLKKCCLLSFLETPSYNTTTVTFCEKNPYTYMTVYVRVRVCVCVCVHATNMLTHASIIYLSNIFCASDIVLQVGPTVVSLDCWGREWWWQWGSCLNRNVLGCLSEPVTVLSRSWVLKGLATKTRRAFLTKEG